MKKFVSFLMLFALLSVFKIYATEPTSSLSDKEKAEFLKVAQKVCKDVAPTCDYSTYIPKYAGPVELAEKSPYTFTPHYEKIKASL